VTAWRAASTLWALPALALAGTVLAAPLRNLPPRVDAGGDLVLTLPATAALEGRVSDDGLPGPPGALAAEWSKHRGPGPVTFEDATAPATVAEFSEPGVYVLRLRASDSETEAADEVLVSVRANAPPIARSQEVATAEDAPVAIRLAGVDREGEPLTFAILEPPAHGRLSGAPPEVTYHPEADYHGVDGFRFTASDGPHTSRPASVGILVTSVNDPPAARFGLEPAAGAAPLTVRVDAEASEDPEGPLVRWAWDFGDGAQEHEPQTAHVLREPGDYWVELTVTDADGATGSDRTLVQVFAAGSARLAYEAERVHLSAPMAVVRDPEASGGAYVRAIRAGQGRVRCAVVVPAPGTFVVWARIRAGSDAAGPFAVSMDGEPPRALEASEGWAAQWRWVQVLGGLALEPGAHRLVFHPQEPGAALDRILVTDDARLVPENP
jgi:hypothetical protein